MAAKPAAQLDTLLDYLTAVGTDETAHTHGSLREHLRGTYDMLAGWGASEQACLAGLFHSVYGTERFQTTTIGLDDRSDVRARIGEHAERLVYLYALLRRSSLYANLDRGWPYSVETLDGRTESLDTGEFVDLMTLDLANRLEQTHGPLGDGDRATYRKAVPVLPAAAVAALGSSLEQRRSGVDIRSLARSVPFARRLKRALLG